MKQRLILCFVFGLILLFHSCEEKVDPAIHEHNEVVVTNPIPSNKVKIDVRWAYTSLPLEMEIREPGGSQTLALWTTGTVQDGKRAPFGDPIPNGQLVLKPGSKKQFLLVMKNPTENSVYFFAAPHSAMPVEHSFGFKFKCLCVNHAFSIPPKETWYRVVEIRLAPDFLGDTLVLTHNLIGITKERMLQFEKSASKSLPSEMD
ncbi:LIC11469 family lipoprotein adhesin Lsa20 [Leptospira levettii]|uniref:Lipoprotein n=1 Tax=Leptospira levettii TaxID=2023178 RepID=A0AAW5V496_9LEPT|nr:hypothetical protein [Leptospira levettii]MCW7466700.1 hypothetical protein [Leptospira levettii]MCW7512423.1 hypothetical protein [Leptospira levettii]MCW7515857.1 hypothetical protein [Leptospira levettii]